MARGADAAAARAGRHVVARRGGGNRLLGRPRQRAASLGEPDGRARFGRLCGRTSTTEGLLLTASNSDSAELLAGNRELAQTLVESNRLYALAAARSGNARLADFLRQLEPVLLELANQPADASVQSIDGLRDYLRKTDLLFQVRATQARIDAADKHKI